MAQLKANSTFGGSDIATYYYITRSQTTTTWVDISHWETAGSIDDTYYY